MKDVAEALGVSTATVSRALQDDPAISVATRRAVLEVAQRVQYRPSAAARRLRTKSTSLIGVVVQSVGDGYIGEVVLGIQSRARDLGYQPLFFAAEGRADLEAEALDVFLSEQVTELIAVSPTGRPELLRRAVAEGMHVAVINGDAEVPARLFTDTTSGSLGTKITRFGSADHAEPICHIRFDDVAAGLRDHAPGRPRPHELRAPARAASQVEPAQAARLPARAHRRGAMAAAGHRT